MYCYMRIFKLLNLMIERGKRNMEQKLCESVAMVFEP